jgi:nucleotide-binding universal stress UspA family protein
MRTIGILISGRGSNMEAILDAVDAGRIHARVGLVISNVESARGLERARRRGVEAIVLGAEEPSRIRGGALLGGRGGPLDNFLGEITKYVIAKAPCQVIITAPPAAEDGTQERADSAGATH